MSPKKKNRHQYFNVDIGKINALSSSLVINDGLVSNQSKTVAIAGTSLGQASDSNIKSGPENVPGKLASQGVATSNSSSSSKGEQGPMLAIRKDAPSINYSRRASKDLALQAASSLGSKKEALDMLNEDVSANSSKDAIASTVKTWEEFHAAWFGVTVPVLPLTIDKMQAVSSMFKKGRYRSYKNYMSAIKDQHIGAGFVWDQGLDRASRKITRSVLRGIGPAKQAGTLDVIKVAGLKLGPEPLVASGPLGPGNLMLAGSFWLTREIELSLALAKHVEFNVERETVNWLLPAKKN